LWILDIFIRIAANVCFTIVYFPPPHLPRVKW
jgi:hypothetical protein